MKVLTDTANKRLSIALDKNPTFDSVTAGTENSTSGGGQAGSIKIVGANSSSTNKATTITAGYAASPELSGTRGTGRISYTDGDGTAHTVAILGDGLKLAGDTGTGSVALDKTLTVSGGAANLADGNNIGVTANESTLLLKLAKDITGLDTVTAGGVKMGTQSDGNDTTKSGKYVTGLDNTAWTVGQTQPVTGRAATEDQLKSVSDVVNSNKTQITTNTENIAKGLNFSASNKVDGTYKTVKKNLGDTVAVRASDAKDDHTYKTDNLTTEIDDNGIITVKMDTQLTADKVTVGTGDNAITIDGSNGSLTTGSSTLNGTGLIITNGPSVTTSGISGGSKQITNVLSGLNGTELAKAEGDTLKHAATIGDLQAAAKGVMDGADAKGLNFEGNTETKIHTNLGGTLKIQGTGAADRDYDGGANVRVVADNTTNTLTVQLDRDLDAHTMTLGKESTKGTAGELGTLKINGQNKDGGISPVSINATYTDTAQDTKTALKTAMSRITYDGGNSNSHTVATLDDGLVIAGDNGQVTRLLNSTLKLSGGETDETKLSSGQNIGVVANKDKDGLDIKLAKDLTGIDSITGLKNTTIGSDFATQGRAATEEQLRLMQSSITSSITQSAQGGGFALTSDEKGDDKIVKQDLGKAIQIKGDTTYKADGSVEKEGNIKTSIDNGAIKVGLNKDVDLGDDGSIKAGGVTISNKGINAGNKNITNLASGIVNRDDRDNTNAANIGDVKTLAGEAAKTEIGKLGSRDFVGDDEKTVSRGLGESMKLSGGADASKLTGGNIGVVKNAAGDGLDIKMSKELKGLTSVTTGNSTLNNDGLTIKDGEGKAGTTITNSGIKIAANGDNTHAVEVTSSNVSMGGQQIHDVADGQSDGDAVNVSQLKKSVGALGGAIDKVDRRVDRVGAGAAALAALHPQDFDPDDKWDFAVGYGNYRGANAAAVGAFYRPNEDTTLLVGGTVGGENMVNVGLSLKLGQGNHVSNSRVAMAKEIKDLRKEVESLRSALVDVAVGKQLAPAKTKLFPDMPKNHWAYKEISELAGNGLLDGYPDGEFKGDRMMTRYEFAQIVYNQMMAGRELSDRLVQEFEPELEHIRIDVIARHKDGTPSIERVRVNKPADKNSK